jgi:hypothetical protein
MRGQDHIGDYLHNRPARGFRCWQEPQKEPRLAGRPEAQLVAGFRHERPAGEGAQALPSPACSRRVIPGSHRMIVCQEAGQHSPAARRLPGRGPRCHGW